MLEIKKKLNIKIYNIPAGLIGTKNTDNNGKSVYKAQNKENIDDGFIQIPTIFLLAHAKKTKPNDIKIDVTLTKINSVINVFYLNIYIL
jgi:hypothetical protein